MTIFAVGQGQNVLFPGNLLNFLLRGHHKSALREFKITKKRDLNMNTALELQMSRPNCAELLEI